MGHMQITRVQCFEFLSNLWQVVQICHFANSQEKPHKVIKCQSTTPTPNIGMFLKKLHLLLRVLKIIFSFKVHLENKPSGHDYVPRGFQQDLSTPYGVPIHWKVSFALFTIFYHSLLSYLYTSTEIL